MKKHFYHLEAHSLLSFIALAYFLLAAFIHVGCSASRQVAKLAREVQKDTIYLNTVQFDSIYVFQERTSDYHMNPLNPLKPSETDTVFVKDVSVEYRYQLLRDTVRLVQHDSIPYEVTVIQTQELRYIPWWAKALSSLGALLLIGIFVSLILKFAQR